MITTVFRGSSCDLNFAELAESVIQGQPIDRQTAGRLLETEPRHLLDLLAAAYRLRYEYFGNRVQLYFLVNAKSGLCPEDCHYCSQSKVADTPVQKYRMLNPEQLLDGAKQAADRNAGTYCIVISGRSPSERELQTVEQVVPQIKQELGLKVCACLGLLSAEEARRLKACGVDRVNHNLNTSERYYEQICTTHTYADRMSTLEHVREAGLEVCSGGIIGMGEQPQDMIEMAFALRGLNAESIPLNFLTSIDGTPLAKTSNLTPVDCLKALAMFRFVNPKSELRIAGGREIHLRSLQPLGLYPANSIFVGDYLTTQGQPPVADLEMIRDMGFEISIAGAESG
jgi:biotin synthase